MFFMFFLKTLASYFKISVYNGLIKQKGAVNMNKIQLMYDVIKTMKEKNGFQGTLKAEGSKDQVKIFNIDREFAKNAASGAVTVKTDTRIDYEGKTVKRESNTELNLKDFDETKHPGLRRLMRRRHGMHFDGLKGGLNRFSLLLHLLNSMNLEEKEDQSYTLSLNLDGFPQELREIMDNKMNRQELGPYFENSPLQELIEKIRSIKDPIFKLNLVINKNHEVEKMVREFNGKLKDENNTEHAWNIKTELSLAW